MQIANKAHSRSTSKRIANKIKIEEKVWNLDRVAEINTVDSFQGRENEIIIVSWVRAGGEGTSISFLNDFQELILLFQGLKITYSLLGIRRL